jgi:hypothetical protein
VKNKVGRVRDSTLSVSLLGELGDSPALVYTLSMAYISDSARYCTCSAHNIKKVINFCQCLDISNVVVRCC